MAATLGRNPTHWVCKVGSPLEIVDYSAMSFVAGNKYTFNSVGFKSNTGYEGGCRLLPIKLRLLYAILSQKRVLSIVLITFKFLAAERLLLIKFCTRLIADYFQHVVNVLRI